MYQTIEEIIAAINEAKQQFQALHNAADTIARKVTVQGNYVVSTATNADQLALKEAQQNCALYPFEGIEASLKKLVLTPKPAAKAPTKAKAPAKKKPAAKPTYG